ncbi:MAG: hypothetical protein AB7S38_08255 [Vulcanimicrobiota bacterium]
MQCSSHPEVEATTRCEGCGELFCHQCTTEVRGEKYCRACKHIPILGNPIGALSDQSPGETCQPAAEALKFAVIGMLCCGAIMGPLAVIKALEAKKLIENEPHYTGVGMANAALLVGGMETLIWLVGLLGNG